MCGASKEQKQIEQEQQQNFQNLSNNAQQVFGNSSQIFKDLTSAFEPVLAAGPGQNGYTAPELAALKSQAITQSGNAYRNASQAAGERIAAAGGGNALLPSGTTAQYQANIAQAGAADTANKLTDINLNNAQIGRQNWMQAAGVLSGAPGVFNPSTSAAGTATQAGEADAQTAGQIQQADRAWVGDVMGVLGDAAQVGSSFLTMSGGKKT